MQAVQQVTLRFAEGTHMTYVRVTERDDMILSAKLVEYSEMPGLLFKQPGVFRSWRGVVGFSLALLGWGVFVYVICCVLARIFN